MNIFEQIERIAGQRPKPKRKPKRSKLVPVSTDSTAPECNTIAPPRKQDGSRVRWRFTLNNYTEEEISTTISYFQENNCKYFFSKEIAPTTGTPHLQGYVEFGKRVRFTQLIKFNPRIQWLPANAEKFDNVKYCSKEKGSYYTNFKLPRAIIFPEFNRPWQLEIIQIVSSEPDNRTIHWYWENVGGVGKTTFVKYLKLRHNAIECPAKTNDAFHTIAKTYEKGDAIDLVIFDIPRSSLDFINYTTIEKIKDGNVVSGKYEGCDCVFASPHVIIFANEPPIRSRLSEDRWRIIQIGSL